MRSWFVGRRGDFAAVVLRFGLLVLSSACAGGTHHEEEPLAWCEYIIHEGDVDPCPDEPLRPELRAGLRPGEQSVVRFYYDSAGRVVKTVANRDHNWSSKWLYDGDGRLEWIETSWRGRTYAVERYERDADGRTKEFTRDTDADGTVDSKATIEHIFSADEHRIISSIDGREVVDVACWDFEPAPIDGTTDTRHTWVYDAEDRLLRHEADIDADGTADEIDVLEYEDGRIVRSTIDRFMPLPDIVEEWSYDARGRLERLLGVSSEGVEWDERFEYGPDWPFEQSCWYHVLQER